MATATVADIGSNAANASDVNVPDIPPEEMARAGTYRLLAAVLDAAPDQATLEAIADLAIADGELGAAFAGLADAATGADPDRLARDFHDLFIGIGEGELVPFGSYYLTGFLHEMPLARLRADLRALGIEPAPDTAEPEDGISTLCEVMAGLITGAFGAPAPLAVQADFFRGHVGCWAPQFFADLAASAHGDFYRRIGALGAQFMTLEAEAFTMADGDSERT